MLIIVKILNRKNIANKHAIKAIQNIMKEQFPNIGDNYISDLPYTLFGYQKMGFQYNTNVFKNETNEIIGFMIYSYLPRYNIYFLDYLAIKAGQTGQGTGSFAYQTLREEAKKSDTLGIFFECFTDNPDQEKNPEILKQNISRLKFYEKFGARPLINNNYDTKIKPTDSSFQIVFDPLDRPCHLKRVLTKKIIKKIIQKKYSDICPPDYIEMVTNSFQDDPTLMREPKYI